MKDSLYKLTVPFVGCAHHMLCQLTIFKTYSDDLKWSMLLTLFILFPVMVQYS